MPEDQADHPSHQAADYTTSDQDTEIGAGGFGLGGGADPLRFHPRSYQQVRAHLRAFRVTNTLAGVKYSVMSSRGRGGRIYVLQPLDGRLPQSGHSATFNSTIRGGRTFRPLSSRTR